MNYGSFQSGTEQGLHRNEQPPPTQQGAFPKGKGAVVANAVTPRRLGLHLERLKAGEQISLVDLANAVKADKERGKGAKPEKKPSIRAQLRADKEKAQKKNAKQKSQDLERS